MSPGGRGQDSVLVFLISPLHPSARDQLASGFPASKLEHYLHRTMIIILFYFCFVIKPRIRLERKAFSHG